MLEVLRWLRLRPRGMLPILSCGVITTRLAGRSFPCKSERKPLPLWWGLSSYRVGSMCGVCKQGVTRLVWRQLSLDEGHEVRFTASECGCGYSLLQVVVVDLEVVDRG